MIKRSDKKAVSVVVGYIILIVIVISMSGIVYALLKTYIPRGEIACPDGVSLVIKDISCVDGGNDKTMTLILLNKGRYTIEGYYIRATNDSQQKIASIDLDPYTTDDGIPEVVLLGAGTGLEPGNEEPETFTYLNANTFYRLEIVPFVYIDRNERQEFAYCGDAKVAQDLTNLGC